MQLQKIIIAVLVIVCSTRAIAQTTNYSPPGKQRFTVYGGFGPNYYFNNLEIGKQYVNDFNYSFTGRFMWEPEHLLSLGFETGWYRLYTFNTPVPNKAHISNTAIPLQIVIGMKIAKTFYSNFAMGQCILLNRATSDNYPDLYTHAVSLADFTTTFGYRRRLSNHFSLSAEAKYFYSTSFVDRNIALLFVGGYSF